MKHKIYLSGPMKGYPESNYPLFREVAQILRDRGHEVYNPADFLSESAQSAGEAFPVRKAFMAYCRYICEDATAIVLLPGWEKSVGVSAELALARNCGLLILHWNPEQI